VYDALFAFTVMTLKRDVEIHLQMVEWADKRTGVQTETFLCLKRVFVFAEFQFVA
jgi:hypothetical protein